MRLASATREALWNLCRRLAIGRQDILQIQADRHVRNLFWRIWRCACICQLWRQVGWIGRCAGRFALFPARLLVGDFALSTAQNTIWSRSRSEERRVETERTS